MDMKLMDRLDKVILIRSPPTPTLLARGRVLSPQPSVQVCTYVHQVGPSNHLLPNTIWQLSLAKKLSENHRIVAYNQTETVWNDTVNYNKVEQILRGLSTIK